MERNYYLPKWKSAAPGILLTIFGAPLVYLNLHMAISAEGSLIETINAFMKKPYLIEVMPFIIGFSLLIPGIIILKKGKKALKAKLDHRGFYYAPMKPPSIISGLSDFIKKMRNEYRVELNFIPYDDIKYMSLEKHMMGVKQIHMITQNSESPNLMGLLELKASDKEELVEAIKKKVSEQTN